MSVVNNLVEDDWKTWGRDGDRLKEKGHLN